jgi:hypothetical protein
MNDTDAARVAQGWGWPGNSRKAHYFLDGELISLCGKWMFAGVRHDTMHASPDNCIACRRRREKHDAD